MADIFQFYSGSADAAPGKGAGETLVSEPSTYAELRKITNWRRLLATGDMTPLPFTGTAELWSSKPKKRRTDLEELRAGVKPKVNIEQQADTMQAQNSKAKSSKSKKPQPAVEEEGGSNARGPSVFVNSLPQIDDDFSPPDMDKKEDTSTIHFCPVCRNYLFAKIEIDVETQLSTLHRICYNCGYKQQNVKGGLVSEIIIGERSAESYKILLNEFTTQDPRLPHIHGTIKCPEAGCPSNGPGKESDIIYMKYDPVNLNFLYICNVCKYTWHSTR
jgi:DNA-directed RNA polymerase subunit M/transcription elongation factor TFIIS